MVLAQTMVLAPNHGASSRAAAISAPRLAMPTQNTTISSSGARLVVTRETYRPCHGATVTAPLLANYGRNALRQVIGQQRRGTGARSDAEPWLAARAPVRRPLLAGRTLVGLGDARPAAQARPASPVDPELVAATTVGRRDPGDPVLVGLEQSLGLLHDQGQVGNGRDRRQRVDPAEEAQLGLVDVAHAGQVALLEKRVADRGVGAGAQVGQRELGVPVRPEQVGAEVADE